MNAGLDPAPVEPGRVLVLDHRDSFVFTLVDQVARLGHDVRTVRTGVALDVLLELLRSYDPHLVLLSPGPGAPEDAGVMVPFLRTRPNRRVLGVCLGHQAMAVAFGGSVGPAPSPVHGRASDVLHRGDPLFEGLPERFRAARYHSLGVTAVPEAFAPIAELADDPSFVMAMRHRTLPYVGIQFHPESILTPFGGRIIANCLDAAAHLPETQHRESHRQST